MATSVAVAGDFSGWEPSFTLDDLDGDGVWSGRVPVRPGVHAYMFVIDGTEWMTDPHAGHYQDDGFGNRNAVLAVGSSG
jgi:1,4-alpha-glucan branching enzyme